MQILDIRFPNLAISWKILITGFILILSAGYLNGALNAALSVGLTPASIAEHYGERSISATEKTILEEKGFIEEEINLDAEEGNNHDNGHKEGMHEPESGVKPITLQEMAQMAHVHLLGFSFMMISIGALACFTVLAELIKAILVGILSLAFLLDIAGLYLIRFISTDFSWLPVVSGIIIGLCIAFISIRVLYELWIMPTTA